MAIETTHFSSSLAEEIEIFNDNALTDRRLPPEATATAPAHEPHVAIGAARYEDSHGEMLVDIYKIPLSEALDPALRKNALASCVHYFTHNKPMENPHGKYVEHTCLSENNLTRIAQEIEAASPNRPYSITRLAQGYDVAKELQSYNALIRKMAGDGEYPPDVAIAAAIFQEGGQIKTRLHLLPFDAAKNPSLRSQAVMEVHRLLEGYKNTLQLGSQGIKLEVQTIEAVMPKSRSV
jgi:hypothetical protein